MKIDGCPHDRHGKPGHVHLDDLQGIQCHSFVAEEGDEVTGGVAMVLRHDKGEVVIHISVSGAIGLYRSIGLCVEDAKRRTNAAAGVVVAETAGKAAN